jgi:hypothetical protein
MRKSKDDGEFLSGSDARREDLFRRRKMVRRLGLLLALAVTICGMGLGQELALDSTPPSRAQVLKLLASMGIQQNIDNALRNTQNKMKASARASFQKKYPDADAATVKKLDEVFDGTPLFSFEDISESVIPAYQKNLSASDVQAGIDFYISEAGKRLLGKLPEIQREANESGGKLVQQKLALYSEQLTRKLEAFEAEVETKSAPAANKPKAADTQSKSTDDKSK